MALLDVRDTALAHTGRLRVEWAEQEMPVLRQIRARFAQEQPLKGQTIGACLHVTTETANLMLTLKAGGARCFLCASNPLSTQDDVAAYLATEADIPTFAIKGEDNDTYYQHIYAVLDQHPTMTMDDGADLLTLLHTQRRDQLPEVVGGTEETTTGVIRLRSMVAEGMLSYPVIAVNDALTKHMFDNRYGTGQSTLDGIIRATNRLLAGRNFVVAGYGWCGRGLAARAAGLGAHVIVVEVDPLKALEAVMDGFQVMSHLEAAKQGYIFCTVTGNLNVFRKEHFAAMQDGAIVCNSGHFNDELDIAALEALSVAKREVRPLVVEYTLRDGRHIYLLADGRLINLASAEGHPAAVMDMSFANQALSAEYMVQNHDTLANKVYAVPQAIDADIARLKLAAMNISIDTLSPEQEAYLASWQSGT
ncbi:MAG TPA: adenosylhomocysteinase [Armatimonadota bacterium]|jgi:adenosylhomocysteinase